MSFIQALYIKYLFYADIVWGTGDPEVKSQMRALPSWSQQAIEGGKADSNHITDGLKEKKPHDWERRRGGYFIYIY